jgi:KaiC/GvpD/RAD55 family RecA-like ATPase
MARIPFGVSRFDKVVDGGAPRGTVVLLVDDAGAGAREFMYTSVTMNAAAHTDEDLFELHYGDLHEDATLPPEVHYISFTDNEETIRKELAYVLDEELVDAAVEHITVRDLSPEYFQLSPVPRQWYLGETTTLQDLSGGESRPDVLTALGSYLNDNAFNNLVVIDSITDLVAAISDDMAWNDIAMLIRGLGKAAHRWNGLVLAYASRETLEETQLGHLMDAADGTLQFEWESGGSKRARTMVVQEFSGVLSQIERENIVRFETEIHEGGFDVSDVRKIR